MWQLMTTDQILRPAIARVGGIRVLSGREPFLHATGCKNRRTIVHRRVRRLPWTAFRCKV